MMLLELNFEIVRTERRRKPKWNNAVEAYEDKVICEVGLASVDDDDRNEVIHLEVPEAFLKSHSIGETVTLSLT